MSASIVGEIEGLEVMEEIRGAHPLHQNYPLLPGDVLVDDGEGGWYKVGPGLGITGFQLTDEQLATLKPSPLVAWRSSWRVMPREHPHRPPAPAAPASIAASDARPARAAAEGAPHVGRSARRPRARAPAGVPPMSALDLPGYAPNGRDVVTGEDVHIVGGPFQTPMPAFGPLREGHLSTVQMSAVYPDGVLRLVAPDRLEAHRG